MSDSIQLNGELCSPLGSLAVIVLGQGSQAVDIDYVTLFSSFPPFQHTSTSLYGIYQTLKDTLHCAYTQALQPHQTELSFCSLCRKEGPCQIIDGLAPCSSCLRATASYASTRNIRPEIPAAHQRYPGDLRKQQLAKAREFASVLSLAV